MPEGGARKRLPSFTKRLMQKLYLREKSYTKQGVPCFARLISLLRRLFVSEAFKEGVTAAPPSGCGTVDRLFLGVSARVLGVGGVVGAASSSGLVFCNVRAVGVGLSAGRGVGRACVAAFRLRQTFGAGSAGARA